MRMYCSNGKGSTSETIYETQVRTRLSLPDSEDTTTHSTPLRDSYQNYIIQTNNKINHTNDQYNNNSNSVISDNDRISSHKSTCGVIYNKDLRTFNNNNNNDIKTENTCRNNCPHDIEDENVSNCNVSTRMQQLQEGLNEPGDSQNPPEPPEWLDHELFNHGRHFYHKYLFCIFFSDILSLLMMFSVSRILRPLIYTDRSDTPAKALKRYVSTIMHIITWFTGDVWDPNDKAHKDILKVRSIHNKSADFLNSSQHYDKVNSITVRDKGHTESSCPFSPAIRQDFNAQSNNGLCLESPRNPPLYISQWDMTVTQYSFLGIILSHPHRMGAWYVTDKDLEGLVHFWRGLGWLLGIEDKYNFCNGTAAETKALCLEMEQLIMVPNISAVDLNHEHMSSALIDGVSRMVPCMSYPAMFRFLADTLQVSVPTFISRMTWKHTFQYWFFRFVFHILFFIPGMVYLFNELLRLALRVIQNDSPKWMSILGKPSITVTPYHYT